MLVLILSVYMFSSSAQIINERIYSVGIYRGTKFLALWSYDSAKLTSICKLHQLKWGEVDNNRIVPNFMRSRQDDYSRDRKVYKTTCVVIFLKRYLGLGYFLFMYYSIFVCINLTDISVTFLSSICHGVAQLCQSPDSLS